MLDVENIEQVIDNQSDDNEEIEISLGDEDNSGNTENDAKESSTITELRKQLRDKEQRLKSYESNKQVEVIEVGDEPTLDDPTIDYDPDKFKEAYKGWMDRKQKAADNEKHLEKLKDDEKKQVEAIQQTFNKQLTDLGVKDFDEAKVEFANSFDSNQKATILEAADNMALVVYALGKMPAKAEELSKISNPAKLAAAIAKLEGKIKVNKKSNAGNIEPNKSLKGGASSSSSSNKELARLEAEADKTGDRTAVVKYKKANSLI